MRHYDTDTDLVVGSGVQAPWPGALYNMPVVIHSHARTGSLVRSVMPDQTLDGCSGHYCVGSLDSFGMPLSGTDQDSSATKTILTGVLVGAIVVSLAYLAK